MKTYLKTYLDQNNRGSRKEYIDALPLNATPNGHFLYVK